jgi:hypothetical protein
MALGSVVPFALEGGEGLGALQGVLGVSEG